MTNDTPLKEAVASPTLYEAVERLTDAQRIFRSRLRIARDRLEMSQEELARRAELPASSISHYESGRRSPSLENVVRIIRAMPGVNANWLLGLASEMSSPEYEEGYFDAMADAEDALEQVSRAADQRFSKGRK